MFHNSKKGFTIVELVIVIAVVAVLAAVLIPTFAGLIDAANMSVDQQFVAQMNKIVAAESVTEKPADIETVRAFLEENSVNTFDATHKRNVFYWDKNDNTIVIWNKDAVGADLKGSVVYPESAAEKYKDLTTPLLPKDGWYALREQIMIASGAGAKMDIDLSQHGEVKASGCDGVFWAKDGATININGEGTVVANFVDGYAMAVWAQGQNSKVVIENGTFTQVNCPANGSSLIYASGKGIVEIKGGTFQAIDPQWTLNLSDNNGTIIVKGGEFYEFNPAEAYTEPGWTVGTTYSFVADGYSVVWQTRDGHDWFKVVENGNIPTGWSTEIPADWCDFLN